MTTQQRTVLRKLQDRVSDKVRRVNEDDPLFEGGPSLKNIEKYLYPEFEDRFRRFLKGEW